MSTVYGKPLERVYCIVPPTGKFIREDRCQTPIEDLKTVALRPPIDLMYAAGAFEAAGCEVRLKDYPGEEHGWEHLREDLKAFAPQALLLSITTPSLELDLKAATVGKEVLPELMTIAKGAHFNTLDVKTLEEHPDLDVVLRGEYEHACRELGEGKPIAEILGLTWRDGEGKIRRTETRPFEADLDQYAFPARHLTNNALYFRPDTMEKQTTLVTNRGCPFSCIYCLANQVSGKKNRYRSPENVVAEIRECVERHGIRNFLFRSDLFTQNKKWVVQLCQLILEAKLDIEWACNSRVDTLTDEAAEWMKKAGCWIIAFGVESGDQEMLDRLEKKATVEQSYEAIAMCRRAGIKSSVYLLMGLPWDTPETIDGQIKFGRDLDPDFLEIFYPYPFPGTPLYQLCVEQGLIQDGEIPKQAYANPAMPGLYLSVEEFGKLRKQALRKIYLRPKYIAKTLANARNPKELANYVKAGMITLKDLMKSSS